MAAQPHDSALARRDGDTVEARIAARIELFKRIDKRPDGPVRCEVRRVGNVFMNFELDEEQSHGRIP